MANHTRLNRECLHIVVVLLITIISLTHVSSQLSPSFYGNTCPSVFNTIRVATQSTIRREAHIGASIIRLFFHDCFVNGCDGSVFLDDARTFDGEKNAPPNKESTKGFEVIDSIKAQVNRACGRSVVSCADILVVTAHDSVVELGGPSYSVPLGRRDTSTAKQAATSALPAPFEDLNSIITKFSNKGFNAREMVALSGAHTVGQARCTTYRNRIYNETNIDPAFATSRRATCPRVAPNGDGNFAPFDPQSPIRFGNNYFQALMNRRGLLHSDQVLFNGGSTDTIVRTYSNNPNAFYSDFANSMVNMGNLSPPSGAQGQVRINCRRIN